MLFRRVLDNLSKQNWLAVVLDFFIVVLGIFVGLQVSNWNEERKSNEQSSIMSERLRKDLKEEAWNYQYLIEYYSDVKNNLEKVISDLEHDQYLNDEEFIIAAYRATQYQIDYRISATFDELRANGELKLIKDEILLKTAIHVYNFELFKTLRTNGQNSKYRELFRKSVPITLQDELLKQCGDKLAQTLDYKTIVNSLDYPCKLKSSKESIKEIVNILKQNKEILGLLRLRYSQLASNISSLTKYYPEIRNGLKALR
ncbi:hypothetical protein [Thalassotalea sp. G2M2-11]|uniref:hypothetical protein n=1 Tax=Thalassotalea sp. G2M2-11 TaxID=2787627 RepID=UPI0019D2FA1E|nr:hypothetical protein [Thalassotalea sp. G2M2-11]